MGDASAKRYGAKMIPCVKKQHYVWQHYLKAWIVDGKIWCKRNNSVFNTSTENIAQERYFYEAKPLSGPEKHLIGKLIDGFHPSAHHLLKSTFNAYIVTSEGNEHLRRNGLEKFHSIVEGKVVPILDELRNGNLDILKKDQIRIDFSHFLGRQYTRTKKIKEKRINIPDSVAVPEPFKTCDFKKVSEVMSFLLADNIGNWIHSTATFNLLRNDTPINFITGDQPIYNLLAKEHEEPTEFELYYPITPKMALLISKDVKGTIINRSEEVIRFNDYIRRIAHESIFADSQQLLI